MCKVARNARSVLLSARQGGHGPPAEVKNAQPQPQPIRAKEELIDEKLAVLPSQLDCRKNTPINATAGKEAAQVIEQTRPEKRLENHHGADGNWSDSMNASLRAISALCLPEPPNVLPGAVIRECLLGQVRRGSYVLSNNQLLPVVVKEFNLSQVLKKTTKSGQGLHEDALVELQIHAYIQKQQIANVIGLYAMHLNMQSNTLSAYLEYAAKGELFSIVKERGAAALPESVCGNFLVQLLQGIDALHSINVVHRDLSLENVLVTADNQIKICDFGLATICPPGVKIKDGRVVGKVNYMCPELYYREEYDPRLVDIWSAAVIFFLMLTGIFPYERPSAEDPRLVMLCNGRINEMLAHWKRPILDEELLQVFGKMFCPPEQRWNAQQLLQLPYCQRFAKVSKVDIAAALANNGRTAQALPSCDGAGNTMSEETATPSLCASTTSHSNRSNGMDSAVSVYKEASLGSTSQLHSLSGSESPLLSPSPSYAKCKFFTAAAGDHAVPVLLSADQMCG